MKAWLFSDKERIQRIRWYVAVRWFYVLSIGVPGIIVLILYRGSFTHEHVVTNAIFITGILAINAAILGVTTVSGRSRLFYEVLAVLQVCLDLVLMTAVFQFNGGIESPIVMLYCIPILMAGVLLSKQAVYITGFSATLIFAVLALLDFMRILSPSNIMAPELHTNALSFWPTLTTTIMILAVITFITNLVSHFVRRTARLEGELAGAKVERAKIDAVVQSMGSSLVATDSKGRVIMVNQAFEQLTGWSALEVIGHSADDILKTVNDTGTPTDDIQAALHSVLHHSKGTANDPSFVGDNFIQRKNGSTFSYTGHMSAIVVDGRTTGATFVFDDASSLREVGQLKSNFIALASHQLKTPIGEIKNYSESMLGGTTGKLNKKQEQYLEHVRDIATRCNQMVMYLLDMSLLERGELRAKLQPVAVYSLLETIARLYKGRAATKGLAIRVTGDKDVKVYGDEMMLQEVLGSLVANSIAYTSKGVIELCVTKVGPIGCIEVTDEGNGLPKATLQQLFKKEAVLSGLPEAGSGSGLGLYLAYEFVRLQGGVIMVDKNGDKGTIFRIELPIKTGEKSDETTK